MSAATAIAHAARTEILTEVITEESEFEGLESEWDELLDASDQCAFFLRWMWLRLWWRTFRPPASRLFLITCRDEGGRLMGLAPFYIRERRVAGLPGPREILFVGTGVFAQTSERLDVVARRGREMEVSRAVALCLSASNDWDRLWLVEIPSGSIMLPYLYAALGPGARVEPCGHSRYIDATLDWDGCKSGFGSAIRRKALPHMRQLFKSHDCRFISVQRREELGPAMARLIGLHQARWQSKGEPGAFALRGAEEFLMEAVRQSFERGKARLWLLEADGEVIAALLAFVDNGVAHYYTTGFDAGHARKSPGSAIMSLSIKECVEDPLVREVDLMSGNNLYKQSWSKITRESVRVEVSRASWRTSLYDVRERLKDTTRAIGRATLPLKLRSAIYKLIVRRRYYSS
jgi:CelD/BcsL family acetyltransferase involved in cellulose biosynthesis